ncbi:MAG: alkaline phosphatase D family protein [Microthrixaceae bacterium]|nr:alkaline phosphatase D family protein [Microthrixaceae bacterium]
MAPRIDRRRLLVGAGGIAGALGLAACTPYPSPDVVEGPWDAGVASGLHAHDAAVLWTRFAPAVLGSVDVDWEVAADPGFTQVIAAGTTNVDGSTDGCVKVLAEGLAAATTYWYRFRVGELTSPVGRTRTLPAPGDEVASMRLAVASCQRFSAGWYPAWRHVADTDLDGVVFLGDYIYESTGKVNPLWDVRDDPSERAEDLGTYRAKYRLYRTDPDLRAAHAAHGFAPVWDDHEFADNYDRVRITEESERAAAAYRAWFEYMPVWPIDGTRIHRGLRFGNLAHVSLLDTRQYRDANPEADMLQVTSVPPASVVHEPDRTLLGTAQRDWLRESLGAARDDGVVHNVIGQQVMVAPIRAIDLDEPVFAGVPEHAGLYFNLDQWDGYSAERDRLTAFLHDEGITDTTILTGDIHSFWQSPIALDMEDPRSPVVAQEYVCGSVSSMAVGFLPDVAEALGELVSGFAPSFRWIDWKNRGFGLLEATPESMQVRFVTVDPRWRASSPVTAVTFDRATGSEAVAVTT